MKEKRKTDVCEGKKEEEGTKWRGREPMKPNLIRNTWADLVYMWTLCVRLSVGQTPTSLEQASAAAATYAVPKWLAALTAVVT